MKYDQPGTGRHPETDRSEATCATSNSGRICSACAPREPQDAPVQRDRAVRKQRVGEGMFAEQCGIVHIHQQAEHDAAPMPTRRGCCTFQNTSASARKSGTSGVRPTQQIGASARKRVNQMKAGLTGRRQKARS